MAQNEQRDELSLSKRPKTLEEVKEGIASERDDYLRGLDVEMRADMDPLLKDDPLSRLGYAVDAIRYKEDNGRLDATHRPSNKEVTYGPETGASEDVIAHEVRHRGIQLLKELYQKDPAGFVEEYGTSAETVLKNVGSELQVELRDNPDATWKGTRGTYSMSDTLDSVSAEMSRTYRDTGEIKTGSEKNDEILTRGFEGLDRAALDLMKERGDVDRVSPKEPEEKGFFRRLLGFNEGGLAMDDQMGMMFKSSRTEDVDPVSGNEVPLGSTPKEVRDDIPAQLSEGEYVVPADVVKFFGVKFFEDIRAEAKQGFQNMEANGRIGGEPVGLEMSGDELPFDISELQMVDDGQPEQPMMNKGGYASGYDEGGMVANGDRGFEILEYVNAVGDRMFIQFMDGKPLTVIPEGYSPKGTTFEEVAEEVSAAREDDDDSVSNTPAPKPIPWTEKSLEDFQKTMDQGDNGLVSLGKTALKVLGGPLVNVGLTLAEKANRKAMSAAVDLRLQNEDLEDRDQWLALQEKFQKIEDDKSSKFDSSVPGSLTKASGIFGGESSLYANLEDTDNTKGASFGDTWLGDALGFDGKFGVEEGNPGLGASLGGARRDGVSSDDSTPTPTTSSGKGNSFFQNVANSFTPNDGKSYVNGELKDDDDEDK